MSPKSTWVLHPTENRTASVEKPHCIKRLRELHGFFYSKYFFQGRENRVHFTSGVNEPQHYQEVNRITFLWYVNFPKRGGVHFMSSVGEPQYL